MNNFEKQLKFGKKYEKKFAEFTKQKYIQSEGYNSWDILIKYNNKDIKYEIKTDKRAYYTGNFVVEYECNNKKSGLFNTDADYWIFNEIINYDSEKEDDYDYDFNIYVVPIDELKNIINIYPLKYINACENNKNKIIIISKNYFSSYKVNKDMDNFFIKRIKNDTKNYTIDELEFMFSKFI